MCAAHLLPTESRPLDSLPDDIASTLRPSTSFERLLLSSSSAHASATTPLPLPSTAAGVRHPHQQTQERGSPTHDDEAEPKDKERSPGESDVRGDDAVGGDGTEKQQSSSGGAMATINPEHLSHSAGASRFICRHDPPQNVA